MLFGTRNWHCKRHQPAENNKKPSISEVVFVHISRSFYLIELKELRLLPIRSTYQICCQTFHLNSLYIFKNVTLKLPYEKFNNESQYGLA